MSNLMCDWVNSLLTLDFEIVFKEVGVENVLGIKELSVFIDQAEYRIRTCVILLNNNANYG